MKKNSAGKIFEGALVGAALGIAAGMLFAPKSGKKIRKDIKNVSADFYRKMAPQVKKMNRIGKVQLHKFAAKSVRQYARAKKLSAAEERALMAEAKRSWRHVQKYLPKMSVRKTKASRRNAKKR